MRRGSWSVASWMLAALVLTATPQARAEQRPGDSASSGAGGNEVWAWFQIGNAIACEYGFSALGFSIPPFVSVAGYLQCRFWPDVADP